MKSKVKFFALVFSVMLMALFSNPFAEVKAEGFPFPIPIHYPLLFPDGGVTQEVYKYKPNEAYKNSPYVVDGYYSHYLQTSDGNFLEIVGTDEDGNPLYVNDSGQKISGDQLDDLGAKVVSDDVVVKERLKEAEDIFQTGIRNLFLITFMPLISLLIALRN